MNSQTIDMDDTITTIGIGDRITIRYPDEYSAAGFNGIDSYIVSINSYEYDWSTFGYSIVTKIMLSNGDSIKKYGDYWYSEKLGFYVSLYK